MTTTYKIRTKSYENIRPNKHNESPKSKHAQPEATYGRAANIKTKGKKECIGNQTLSNTKTTNKRDWKKDVKVLFH